MLLGSGNNKNVVEMLITAGADIDARDNQGNTALMEAARRDHGDM